MSAKEVPSSSSPATSSNVEALPAALEAEIFWTKYKNKILGGLALLGVAVLLYVIFQITTMKKAMEAGDALANAKTPEELRSVISAYPGEPVAGDARIMLAEKLRKEGKLSEAVTELEAFVKEQPNHPLAPGGWLGIASMREQQDQNDAALSAYQTIASQFSDTYVGPFAWFSQAKLLARMGKVQEAKQLMEQLVVKFPGSTFSQMATMEMENLAMPTDFTFVDTPAPTPTPAPGPEGTMTPPIPAPEGAASPVVAPSPSAGAAPLPSPAPGPDGAPQVPPAASPAASPAAESSPAAASPAPAKTP